MVTPDPHEPVEGSLTLSVRMGEGTGKAEINDGLLQIGATSLPLDGAVGPSPERSEEGVPLYRFELLSNGAMINALDTGLPPLSANILLRGDYDPLLKIISGHRLAMNMPEGRMEGWVALALVDPLSFGASLEADYLAAEDIKRLWPYTVGPEARAFVLQKLQGGAGRNIRMDVAAPLAQLLNPEIRHSKDELKITLAMEGVATELPDDLPKVENAAGTVTLEGSSATIRLARGVGRVDGGMVELQPSTLEIPDTKAKPLRSQLSLSIKSDAASLAKIAGSAPINAPLPVAADHLHGDVLANVEADLILGPTMGEKPVSAFAVSAQFEHAKLDGTFQDHTVADADGTMFVDPDGFTLRLAGRLDDLDARFTLLQPREGPMDIDLKAVLDEKSIAKLAPALSDYVSGTVDAQAKSTTDGALAVSLDLKNAAITFPPVGWSKGLGVPGTAEFTLQTGGRRTRISDLELKAGAARIEGELVLENGRLESAEFPVLALTEKDNARLSLRQEGKTMRVTVRGNRLDGRSIIRTLTQPAAEKEKTKVDVSTPLTERVELDAMVGSLGGFGGESLRNAKITFSGTTEEPDHAVLSAVTRSGKRIAFTYERAADRRLDVTSGDAGSLLRFADLYDKMAGGRIKATLQGGAEQPMTGKIDITDFTIVDEPRLDSLASRPVGGSSLNDQMKGQLDTESVTFDSGSVSLVKSKNRLDVSNGVVRGPQIGMMFEGTVYDAKGQMNMTGTFMPAYGLNRLFGEIPLVGALLGNGRDKGLIGVTYRLSGAAKDPKLTINPLSVIAPGIFRSIFAFR